MNSEREKADILFNYGLPLQFCCHLIQFYTVLSLRTATLNVKRVLHVFRDSGSKFHVSGPWCLIDLWARSCLGLFK